MSNPYSLIVFDWEGTIADTLGFVLHLVSEEAHALGFGAFDFYQARKYIDLGLTQALKKMYPHISSLQHQQLLLAVQQAMHSKTSDICLISGVRELLGALTEAGVNLAIATNKGQASLARALQVTGLNKLIKVTRSAGQVPAKPCPQMLEEIMDEFGATAATTLMVGDSPTDIEMAQMLQVAAIGIDVYHQQHAALKAAGAVAVFDDYKQVADFLDVTNNSATDDGCLRKS